MSIGRHSFTTWTGPAGLGAAVRDGLVSFHDSFMRLTVIRTVVALFFVALCSYWSIDRTTAYYSGFEMPPSFRHMDPTADYRVISNYLEGQRVGSDTLLVLGDCVAFGHGVKNSFSRFLNVPNLRIVNVSMQSFDYELMLLTVAEAARRGVRHVLVQLHPFVDYGGEAVSWEKLAKRHPASNAIKAELASTTPNASNLDFVEQATVHWRLRATTAKSAAEPVERILPYDLAIAFSALLRYDVFAQWDLYRNRFAIDDWLGVKLSYYSTRTRRSDSFVKRLSDQRQVEIFKNYAAFWPKFVVEDRDSYRQQAAIYSAPVRMAQAMKKIGVEAVFVMAPTMVDLISKHTVVRRSDLLFVSETLRQNVALYGARYIDFLENAELEQQMIHFDNLTADGQKMLGQMINEQLTAGFGNPGLQAEKAK